MASQMFFGFAKFLNKIFGKFGFQIVRISIPERLMSYEAKNITNMNSGATISADTDTYTSSLESRISKIESRLSENMMRNIISYAMKSHWRMVDLIEQISGSDKPETCPLCGFKGQKDEFIEVLSQCMFLGGRLLRHTCPSCDVIFGPQKMLVLDNEMLDLDYKNLYQMYSEGNSTDSIIRTFHLLNPHKNGVYLDFGCGGEWSEAICRLRQEGWNIFGFEPSAANSSEHVFTKWEEVGTRKYDGILSHNVLEHLFDPVEITRKLGTLLSPGARIIHATPCFEYRYDFTHYHVYFFIGRSPEILAARSGMKIEEWVRDGEYIACILQKSN